MPIVFLNDSNTIVVITIECEAYYNGIITIKNESGKKIIRKTQFHYKNRV